MKTLERLQQVMICRYLDDLDMYVCVYDMIGVFVYDINVSTLLDKNVTVSLTHSES